MLPQNRYSALITMGCRVRCAPMYRQMYRQRTGAAPCGAVLFCDLPRHHPRGWRWPPARVTTLPPVR